jgi:hypothetical protein
MIRRQKQLHARLFATLFDFRCSLKLIVFHERLANRKAFGFEERVSHLAANQQPINSANR